MLPLRTKARSSLGFVTKKEVRKTVLSQKVNVSTKKRRKNQSYFMLRSSIKLFSLLGFVSSNLTKRGCSEKFSLKFFTAKLICDRKSETNEAHHANQRKKFDVKGFSVFLFFSKILQFKFFFFTFNFFSFNFISAFK